jgi:ATP-binding cassette subfamily C (CFTR/MRP) protein 1
MYRLMVKLRGALVGLLYHDMLLIRAESRNSSSAMSLMSTDVDRITLTARWVIDIIPNIVQLGFAMFILSTQIGAVCIAPVVVALLCGGVAVKLSKMTPIRQRMWMAAIQKRVGITSDIMSSMRGIKMTGLTDPITKQIQALRDFELAESRKFRKLQIIAIMMSRWPIVVSPGSR